MKRSVVNLYFLIALFVLLGAVATIFVVQSDHAVILHPKGEIAHGELRVMSTQVLLMLTVIAPTFILIFLTAWKFRDKKGKSQHQPDQDSRKLTQCLLWIIPAIVITAMAFVVWNSTHQLDPYKPIENGTEPLTIQVVALDWKWLFIYPEQEIATVNYLLFPAKRAIHLKLAADGSPMNSFWIPQLCGQIYCMTGMVTPLHLVANEIGEFSGKAAEINGMGYAGMTFLAKSVELKDFLDWIKQVKQSPLQLTSETYEELTQPSESDPITLYSHVEQGLFKKILMKYCNM